MIPHRLAAGLKRQDWAAVIIEFLLVVVGVFVGLQVANWNDDRKDRVLEKTYVARIQSNYRPLIN